MLSFLFIIYFTIGINILVQCESYQNCSQISDHSNNNISNAELRALCDLYESTQGNHWNWRKNTSYRIWNFTNPSPCNYPYWQGIECGIDNNGQQTIVNLTLVSYHLNGSLSNSLGDLTSLTSLILDQNNLTNSIPYSIGNLNSLTMFSLNNNQLINKIPDSMRNIKNLTHIQLWNNNLTGTFPLFLCDLLKLRVIFIPYNHISGTLPNCLGNLIQMRAFVIESNAIEGAIPSSLGSLNEMYFIDMISNHIHGSIPDSIGNLSKSLKYLYLSNNKISGTIPSSFQNLKKLVTCSLTDNLLSGTYPKEFTNLEFVASLLLNNNALSGILPDTISNFPNLDVLILAYNYFSGSIPNNIGDYYKNITSIFLNENHFSGSIPKSIGKLSTLYNLDIQKNSLHGKLPKEISQLKSLTSLNLLNNKLTGSLSNIFDSDLQQSLSTIQLSHNQFTGDIPKEIFKLKKLKSISLESNCFEASLPIELCKSTLLNAVDFNGLHTASSCQYKLLPGISNSYVSLGYVVEPSIPTCYFTMPNLLVLHLSGNSLTGEIPTFTIRNLTDLSLSHNSLSGSIPLFIQKHKWLNLDLSHNKFNGILHSSFASQDRNASLNLEVNRLSGHIPNTLLRMKNISILDGNIFSCTTIDDLPRNDDNRETYECGSNSFNTPYLIFASILTAIILGLIMIFKFRKEIEKHIAIEYIIEIFSKWYKFKEQNNELIQKHMKNYSQWCELLKIILKIACYSSIYIIFILTIFYVVLAHYYSAAEYSYAWIVSLGASVGIVAGSIELTILLIFILFIIILFQWFIDKYSIHEFTESDKIKTDTEILNVEEIIETNAELNTNLDNKLENKKKYRIIFEKAKVYVAYMLINFIVTLGANIAYIYAVFYAKPYVIALSRILLSIFKMVWSGVCCPILNSWCILYLTKVKINGHRTEFFTVQLFVGLMNNITIPCITVGVISPNCFYNFFVKTDSIYSTYYYVYRFKQYFDSSYEVMDTTYASSTSYEPPFVYGYQCASSIITSYSPAFIYLCILAGFVNPVGQILLQQIHHRIDKNTYLNRAICSFMPRILIDIDDSNIDTIKYDLFKPISNARQITVNLITFLGLLLTFGAAFPPLAFALLVTTVIMMNFTNFKIARFLYNSIQSNYLTCLDIIDLECYGTVSVKILKRAQWMLAGYCSCFYSLFIFDAFGDEVGTNAYWILIFVPISPWVFYQIRRLIYYLHEKYHRTRPLEPSSNQDSMAEMSHVTVSTLHSQPTITIVATTAAVELDKSIVYINPMIAQHYDKRNDIEIIL